DNHREATEDCDLVSSRQVHLEAAVDGESRTELVDRASIDSRDGGTVRLLAGEPERFGVRIQVVGGGHARGHRHQLLREMRVAVACADPSDAVVAVDMPMPAEVRAGQ